MVWQGHSLAARTVGGWGCVSAVCVLKRHRLDCVCVCVASRPSERSRWVKSIFVLGSYFRWKWNTWWGEIVITHLQGEWQTIAAVKFSHISPALYSWLPSTLWPSLSFSTSSQLSQSLSTSSTLPFLPGIFAVFFPPLSKLSDQVGLRENLTWQHTPFSSLSSLTFQMSFSSCWSTHSQSV